MSISSHLDNKISQTIFQGVFCNYLKNKTRIMIFSKKTFLSFVDKIIYLEKGKIAFFGNYEQFKKYNKEIDENFENNENSAEDAKKGGEK